jgi:hypothetical protein
MSSKDAAYLRALKNTIWRAEDEKKEDSKEPVIQHHSMSPGKQMLVLNSMPQQESQKPRKIKLSGP